MIGVPHGGNVPRSDLVAFRHELSLRPLRQRMFARIKEDVSDQSCMPSIPISEGMDLRQPVLKARGDVEKWHRRCRSVPIKKVIA